APFAGTIGLRQISVGAYVSPATTVATLRQINKLKLDFSVPEKYGREVKSGQKIDFTIEGTDKLFHAIVLATEEGVSEETRTLNIRAVVDESSSLLIPGAFAQISLKLSDRNKALMAPTQAVIPQARDKRVIVSRNGKAQFVAVQTGIRRESDIEILSGLAEGDTIVVTGMLFLRPDAPLKFAKIN
ncbi:MAG: efflux RND transporter periplasmic adaptor subunit, partial [Bacteroidetes bacterium]